MNINGDCFEIIEDLVRSVDNPVIVSDPPFNIGYHYNTYKDKLPHEEYVEKMKSIFSLCPSVIIHYPESIYELSLAMDKCPQKVVSWVYNSNTGKQHRDIAFFDIKPDFKRVTQPYKNPNDKRIKKLIKEGHTGSKLYDWWNINQVKNVSKEKTAHPCQMPEEVMDNVIGILPSNITVIDPFMGSGTTGVSCKKRGISFIGIEQDKEYYDIAEERLGGDVNSKQAHSNNAGSTDVHRNTSDRQ